MDILIIGGSGILSSAVVDCCLEKGYNVTMMNRGNISEYTNKQANVIICDARDDKRVMSKIAGLHFDVVIDFIVFTKEQLVKSLDLFGKIADQYVFISSAQVYNTSNEKILEETDETPQPLWSYSVNKDICEKYLRNFCEENHTNYTIVRPGVNYDNRRIPYGMYPSIGMHWTMVARILAGKPIITWNHGENKLNLTRVEDFAVGLVELLGNEKAYNEIFNVCGDFIYTWKEVLEVLGELLNIKIETVDLPLRDYANELGIEDREMLLGGRACDLVCSNAKLKSIAPNFSSKICLREGLLMTLEWYKSNDFYQGFDYRWDAEQDRIIRKLAANRYRGGYTPYSRLNALDDLQKKCIWKIEYYKDNANKKLAWKIVRKFMSEPLKKLFAR